ncbi:hypothetical protein [Clostridium botulinum]|uniref:hypothetical protein n=1 Tax=Clostridium botulinum TaxID=1491 RepID=UPI00174DBB22|nr:hypothetical protein [Clostridium botulinum]MBD5589106.1 hypothetical protein [Clostridium botulinum]MBY6842849.1 hypothetical protein [Clostridium botulinum]
MEILSQDFNNKKSIKGVERYKKVYKDSQKQYIGNTSYITVNVLGRTWRVKKEAENKWLKIAKVEDFLRDNLSDVLGAISVAMSGILIYFIMIMFS